MNVVPPYTSMVLLVAMAIITIMARSTHAIKESDVQILKRVIGHLQNFMNEPVHAVNRMTRYRNVGGFPRDLHSADLDHTQKFLFKEIPLPVYYGLEDGTFFLYYDTQTTQIPRPGILHRQPGFSGYPINPVPDDSMKHWISCVESDGSARNCTLPEGSPYVKCIDECKIEKCDTIENSLLDCSLSISEEERVACEESITWCPQYSIETVQEGEELGTVSGLFSCIDAYGSQAQTPGMVIVGDSYEEKELGNCYFADGETLVNRSLVGNYDSCGEGEICNPFIGTFMTPEYDPRYRPWYVSSKQRQKPLWTDPYPFWGEASIGITYTEPIYKVEGNRKIFKGVFAVDYTLANIREFLSQYKGSEMYVLVVEAEEPHYVVAVSTGSVATKYISNDDPTKSCSEASDATLCTVVRVPLENLNTNPDDIILQKAFEARAAAGFPTSELVPFKKTDVLGDQAYISQGDIFEQANANLKWHVIVVTPMQRNTWDAAYIGSAPFYIIITACVVGFFSCMVFFSFFFGFRKKAAFQNKDWRFTCAFIFGCSLLNLSSLALLGENRDEMCMLRMWSFNLLFATALSPLFVKVWRMHKLLHASKHFKRVTVTNFRAMLYTLPIILAEALLLTLFSFVDPPRSVEELGVADLEFGQVQEVTCQHVTNAFFQTQVVFDAFLVLFGCYLAFETRNLDPRFGEAKQLAFAMYNIAFTGIIIILITRLVEMDQSIRMLLQAIGVTWGTVFNSAAFVVPKLYEVQRAYSKRMRRTSVHFGKKFVTQGKVEVLVDSNSGNFSSFIEGLKDFETDSNKEDDDKISNCNSKEAEKARGDDFDDVEINELNENDNCSVEK